MKKALKWIGGAVVAIIVISAIFSGGGEESATPAERTASQSEPAQEQPEESRAQRIRAGMHKVGTDIPPGEYLAFANNRAGGYWQVSSDSTGDMDSIIANDNCTTFAYVQIEDGEYLTLTNSHAFPRDQYTDPLVEPGEQPGPGTYKVGVDIDPGEYRLVADNDQAYYHRARSPRGVMDSIITNELFSGSTYATVQSGEYFKIQGAHVE